MKEWICSCGHINSGNFCGNCGKPKRILTVKKIDTQSDSSMKTMEQSVEKSVLAEISTIFEVDDGNSSSSKEITPKPSDKKSSPVVSKTVKRAKSELSLSGNTLAESSSTSRPVKTKSQSSKNTCSKNESVQPGAKKDKSKNQPPQEATEDTSRTRTSENIPEQTSKTTIYAPPPAPSNNFMQRNRPRYYFDEESLFSSFRKDPKEFLIQRKDIFIKGFVFFLFFMLTSFNFSGSGKRTNTKPPIPATVQETTTPVPTVITIPAKPYQLPSIVDMHNVTSELSLGAICLGDSLEKVHSILGYTEKTRNKDDYLWLCYPDIEIGIRNNIVESITSKTDKVETKRGIHQNSIKQDIISAYGKDYRFTNLEDGSIIIIYLFDSPHGKKAVTGFIMKDDRVMNVSVTTIDKNTEQKEPIEREDVSIQVFRQYWDKLNSRDFAGAYNLMTDKQQNQMGEFENYRNGYNEMIENKLTDVKIIEKTDTFVRIAYTLQAKDRVNGQIKVQIFQGIAHMVRLADSWRIDNLEAKLVRAFNEQ